MERDQIIEFYSKYSSQFDAKIGTLDLYDESYTSFIERAKKPKNLLDLACGPGNVSQFIKNLIPDTEITCVDLSEEMLTIAKQKIPDGKFFKSDILDINIPKETYDLIICAFGLPYIQSEEIDKLVAQVNCFSHQDSLIYISCMKGEKSAIEEISFANKEKLIINYHTKENVLNEFRKGGYELIDYKEQDYPELDGSVTTDMIFNFSKQN
ncbi:class I SAM-dependent DNA methyltransferase [Sunxiuqinia sp. A32]|uniref:class I SAM-dependent DNA methyltransferase n=1 Tax=Sunxiuqinia sp. A32 TaxID=3461496 RepID=UPI0040457112